jgi:hypothetical protein
MADSILFTAGATKVADSGVTGKCSFALSTKPCSGAGCHVVGDVVGSFGEITGTGYARLEEEAPAAVAGAKAFAAKAWKTEAHTDWPASVKSCCMVEGGVLIAAWNLQAGGILRDLSGANTTESFSPVFTLS